MNQQVATTYRVWGKKIGVRAVILADVPHVQVCSGGDEDEDVEMKMLRLYQQKEKVFVNTRCNPNQD